nr:protein yippee-like 5 [Parasteatoda tepidariorum]XP_042913521.1 protein yippee-like 5 [Parasteatoda tepidariorum]
MGVIFLQHLGGNPIFSCYNCGAFLTNHQQLINKKFTSHLGPAWLFRKVVNVYHSVVANRNMVTGKHKVRDVFCKSCDLRLGWFYEFAFSRSQQYKEGCTILEVELLKEEPGFDENNETS